jgi:peptidoglycan/xylan/chitin deacetylase (PgdA/CDA1 family)
MKTSGKFVISLDFELYWGIRDKKSIDEYASNILGVWEIMPVMLDMFDSYQIDATFATVGFLFASTKDELIRFCPKFKPNYDDLNLSPYNGHFDSVNSSEEEDKYHYASQLIEMIRGRNRHEIGTHTFSHYFCLEKGQTLDSFRRDMQAAVEVARFRNVEIKSLVFPKNQVNPEY